MTSVVLSIIKIVDFLHITSIIGSDYFLFPFSYLKENFVADSCILKITRSIYNVRKFLVSEVIQQDDLNFLHELLIFCLKYVIHQVKYLNMLKRIYQQISLLYLYTYICRLYRINVMVDLY